MSPRWRRATATRPASRSLKVRHNNLIGYHIEVTAAHLAKVPMASSSARAWPVPTRYATPELAELESRIASAADRALALEIELFEALRQAVLMRSGRDRRHRRGPGRARCRRGLGRAGGGGGLCAAADRRLRRIFAIAAGRHPVVEQALRRQGTAFVANDCALGGGEPPVAADRPQHGRQEHLPAPERADRGAWRRWAASCRRPRPGSASSTGCSAASGPPTTWRAAARPSWSRWSRRRRSCTRPGRGPRGPGRDRPGHRHL